MPTNPETHTGEPITLAVQSLSEYEKKYKELSESHKTGAMVSLNSHYYKKIFGKQFVEQYSQPWKKGIVMITGKNEKTIYRLFHGGGIEGDTCVLDDLSLRMLGNKSNDEITLKAAPKVIGRFRFYWQHPNDSARVSFKSGVFYCIVSIVLTVVSTLIGIFLK